jgi:hypothetical protein
VGAQRDGGAYTLKLLRSSFHHQSASHDSDRNPSIPSILTSGCLLTQRSSRIHEQLARYKPDEAWIAARGIGNGDLAIPSFEANSGCRNGFLKRGEHAHCLVTGSGQGAATASGDNEE